MVADRAQIVVPGVTAIVAVVVAVSVSWLAWRALSRVRAVRPVPEPPDTLYRWLAEVRMAAQKEHELSYLDFQHSIGGESLRFLLAWNCGKLQLRISGPGRRYRFATCDSPARRWFDLGPADEMWSEPDPKEDIFWQLGEDDHMWRPVSTPEQHAEGLMLAKLFFATWQERVSGPSAGRLTVS